MIYRSELAFLCSVLKNCRVKTAVMEQRDWQNAPKADTADNLIGSERMLCELFPTLQPRTAYRLTDSLERSYRFLLLPDVPSPTVLCIGPYLSSPVSPRQILEIGEQNGVPPQQQGPLTEYYAALPVLSADSHIFTMLNTFCEKIWSSGTYETQDIVRRFSPAEIPISRSMRDIEPTDVLLKMKNMERRYAFENEMIRAVTAGLPHMGAQFQTAFSNQFFEKRVADPLRNAKNYGIIMNTLLRKAAERGGVHPIYLDQISSEYAAEIENLSSAPMIASLMQKMFLSYCRLVRKHCLKKYSLAVQKAILIIDADLSSDLSASVLATSQGISLGYLSTIFKKETGQTISEYIRRRRMEYATYLLSATELQIQTIALHCGIMDVQYFSRIFKKQLGITPSQYRAAHKRAAHSPVG